MKFKYTKTFLNKSNCDIQTITMIEKNRNKIISFPSPTTSCFKIKKSWFSCYQYFAVMLIILTFLQPATSQNRTQKGTVERIKVFGKALEGNLSGDSPNRDVTIYLPSSYKKESKRRYPVIYFLHGFTDSDAKVFGLEPHWMNMEEVLNQSFAISKVNEMIIVAPNAFTKFYGSMYSNSVTVGNWEDFIAKDLVEYIDSHYRTLPSAISRGLAGHSMGGYGTLRIGQKYPTIFSSLYLLSPCCLSQGDGFNQNPEIRGRLEKIRTKEDLDKADFFAKAAFASAAAWSPNPTKPPFYIDLPFENGQVQEHILLKWAANRPLVTVDQNIYNLRRLKGIAFDAGNKDKGIAESIKELDQIFNRYGIKHLYEEYEGDHLNRVAERIEKNMLPFFSENLSAEQKK